MIDRLIKKVKLEVSYMKTYWTLLIARMYIKLGCTNLARKRLEKAREIDEKREPLSTAYIKAVQDSWD